MPTVETIVEQFELLSDEDQERVMRELTRRRLSEVMRKIAARSDTPLPLSDEEINEIVHEARGEMLRARGPLSPVE